MIKGNYGSYSWLWKLDALKWGAVLEYYVPLILTTTYIWTCFWNHCWWIIYIILFLSEMKCSIEYSSLVNKSATLMAPSTLYTDTNLTSVLSLLAFLHIFMCLRAFIVVLWDHCIHALLSLSTDVGFSITLSNKLMYSSRNDKCSNCLTHSSVAYISAPAVQCAVMDWCLLSQCSGPP